MQHSAVAEHPPTDQAEHAHPTPAKYVWIAIILFVVTAVEVALYYSPIEDLLEVSLLSGLMAIKFHLVAAWFMHLKFDGRLVRRLFVTGIVLAVAVYAIALFTLGVLFN